MTQTLENDRLLRVLNGQPVDRTPVWIMRQAGRYLPEYRKIRAQAGGFMDLCTNPDLACEVTLQPLRRFNLDAAILFSDILTIPDAMGLGLHFTPGEGPQFEHPVRSAADVANLSVPDMETELRYVMDAVRTIRHELRGKVPLIGFSGSPWTLATYMVEGASTKTFSEVKKMLYGEPDTMTRLLDVITAAVIDYLRAQIAAGAQVLMVFDTWGGVLTPATYLKFSLRYMQQIVEALRETAPVILFTKNAGPHLTAMAATGCHGLGVDWTTDLATARQLTQDKVVLQGNLDPSALNADPAAIEKAVADVLASYGQGHQHIFNLGHGIHPNIPPEHVEVMVNAVQQLSPAYHQA